MNWTKRCVYVPRYEYASCNQHGDRFKRIGTKKLSIVRMACKPTDADGMKKLILLSHTLDVPVRYDFEGEQKAYMEVISGEALRGAI